MAKADIELLFGVLGGGSISGKSGTNIKDDLDRTFLKFENSEFPSSISEKLAHEAECSTDRNQEF